MTWGSVVLFAVGTVLPGPRELLAAGSLPPRLHALVHENMWRMDEMTQHISCGAPVSDDTDVVSPVLSAAVWRHDLLAALGAAPFDRWPLRVVIPPALAPHWSTRTAGDMPPDIASPVVTALRGARSVSSLAEIDDDALVIAARASEASMVLKSGRQSVVFVDTPRLVREVDLRLGAMGRT